MKISLRVGYCWLSDNWKIYILQPGESVNKCFLIFIHATAVCLSLFWTFFHCHLRTCNISTCTQDNSKKATKINSHSPHVPYIILSKRLQTSFFVLQSHNSTITAATQKCLFFRHMNNLGKTSLIFKTANPVNTTSTILVYRFIFSALC